MTLEQFFEANTRVAAAFSGGADSAFLLWAARQYGCQVHAYYVRTAFQPEFEWEDAKRLAGELKIPLTVIDLDVLDYPEVKANGPRRCYFCKQKLFMAMWEAARKDGYSVLMDGTNASDDAGDRPGMTALSELKVVSPLRLCGLTKEEVRRRSKEAGLFTWDKPAYACLATRIPTGTMIGKDDLIRIEQAEAGLSRLGFSDFRIRLYHGAARIQVTEGQAVLLTEKREEALALLKPLFPTVLMDMECRKASV